MMQVGAAELPASGTAASFVQWCPIIGMAGIPQIERAGSCKGLTVSARSRRKNTIEHVDAAQHGAGDVVRLADAHQIAWTFCRQMRNRRVQNVEHRRLAFADGQSPHGVTVETDFAKRIDRTAAQCRIDPALYDTKTSSPRLDGKCRLGARRPACRKLGRLFDVGL